MSGAAVVGGYPYRVSESGTVTRRERGVWRTLTRAELLALPRDGEVWTWLREQGVRRPSPSGPSGRTTPDDERDGTRMTLRLDSATTRALDALARRWGVVRSQAIARALREAADRE